MSITPEGWEPPLVVLIGMGTDREDLSLRALRWIEQAEVLAGGRRHLAGFPKHPGEKIPLESPLGGHSRRSNGFPGNERPRSWPREILSSSASVPSSPDRWGKKGS